VQDDVIMDPKDKAAAALAASDKKKKVKRGKDGKPERPKREAAPQYDADGDLVDSLKIAEKKSRAQLKKTTKNYKAQDKADVDAEKAKNESFEVVPISAEDEALEHLSSDDDAIAERLALGKHMLAKKSRNALINDSYNRYSLDRQELSQLPEWFVRDEAQHHTPILPVSKAEDGVLHINFQKAVLAETWPSVLKGHANLNSAEQEQETQKILLERFAREVRVNNRSEASKRTASNSPRSLRQIRLNCFLCMYAASWL
jgi:hypothetical protein